MHKNDPLPPRHVQMKKALMLTLDFSTLLVKQHFPNVFHGRHFVKGGYIHCYNLENFCTEQNAQKF